MSKDLIKKAAKKDQRKKRIRSRITGTTERPRLSVSITLQHVSAQIIDDTKQSTIAYVTTVGKSSVKGNLTEKSAWVGTEIAKAAQAHKIKRVVFDRNGKLYHGRVAALADAAREQGLEF
ncbi:MAG TPA: 50S ribosomal protein L18 [Candidatus Saccharimonadales bacterium]|nr:50S ribosomal protein L18 [Candidatus Saccharimonadales bacterium]